MSSFDVDFTEKQSLAIQSAANEILYGGAAGGGKSFFMRALAIILCGLVPGLNVYLFRRTSDELIKNHIEGPNGFPVMLSSMVLGDYAKITEEEIRFWNGSKIFLCHCKDEKNRFNYLGAEIHVLLMDELTTFTDVIYRFLRARMRAPGLVIPQWAIEFFQDKFGVHLPNKIPLALSSSNPGNIGHLFVKAMFIDGVEPLTVRRMPKSEGGMLRQFIPAVLEDNPHIDAEEYGDKLAGLGSDELVRAMRYGDWNVIAGAFFDNWREDRHVIPRFVPPAHWTRLRSMDWGSFRPFSVGWWCIAENEWVDLADGTERRFPAGSIIRYREWYGVQTDPLTGMVKPNVGLKLDVEVLARGIMDREKGETIDEQASVADPSMWKEDGGPSFVERMAGVRNGTGPRFRPADNSRVVGAQQVRARLNGEDGVPLMYVTVDCRDFIRTFPALQHDEKKPEDVNTAGEDHSYDDARYACMSRPLSNIKPPKKSGPAPWSLEWVMQNG